ncbi:hypothetical protein BDY19DRAFT_898933 [Irpex rosettiformis]|uniref:Uncharacterized protein n=1 Tax=Irpex rosettiformis TaxID=378272 RepID=A0ACB8TQC2_9APHY|nr:hypothetical protein BDY19DRAFT_898933 [Irpex rosettiformis]
MAPEEHHSHDMGYPSDEEHSVLEDDSDGEERDDYMDDDDDSSSLSIPNESIDFDLVYALHSFAATVDGQANVVKGDSLFLMDDSNSYWWLVRVLKTQEVGYIPAENIETPFERLARLNKHRNVDLASATQAELQESRDRILSSRTGSNQASPSPTVANARNRSRAARRITFTASLYVHRYLPAVWGDEEEEDEDTEWDDEAYSDEDPDLAEEQEQERERAVSAEGGLPGMEPDDGMSWEDGAVERIQAGEAQVIVTSANSQMSVDVSPRDPSQLQDQQVIALQRAQDDQQRGAAQPAQPPPQVSRERPAGGKQDSSTSPPTSPGKVLDPAQATETRKVSITPSVARSVDDHSPAQNGPLLPSAIMQQQHEERKRTREEIEALEEAQRKKANKGPSRSSTSTPEQKQPGKLRKDRDRSDISTDDAGGKDKDKKKKSGVFGGLFGRNKGKGKDKGSVGISSESSGIASIGSVESVTDRASADSGRSSSTHHGSTSGTDTPSPVTASARHQQQQAIQQQKTAVEPRRPAAQPQTSPAGAAPVVAVQLSQHASQLRQRDQQQQALYQQYLNRSPSSPPEAQPSYGLQSASAVMPNSNSLLSSPSSANSLTVGSRPRPGSLVLSPGAMDGQGIGLPDLSVIRVFAGNNLQTEATFKTVLLNSSTSASELVRQAVQRFRLPGDDISSYYLSIKQVEGSSATLLPAEKPLVVFESLVEAAMELPKVKRSSVGSISSISSNLSMHPAIKKLPMNDFTDDSAVKFYLNRKGGDPDDPFQDEAEESYMAESPDEEGGSPRFNNQYLSINTGLPAVAERFSSPSFRFALQLVIHPEDLPDDMVFDPLTEAIVFKDTLRDRHGTAIPSPGISATQRRKIFLFPKNVTVAEVIEQGLERFGIIDGVVDGGDEVEDKLAKRRSSTRVRYILSIDLNGKEQELSPTSKVIDAYPRPPIYRAAGQRTSDSKRRSMDSTQLLGNPEDVSPGDPAFVLRRAIAYRPSSKHRSSAPLDEIALQKLQRESLSGSSVTSDSTISGNDEPKRQLSKQEIIAAQRAATRANQRAILRAQTNSSRGLDVLLPGNAMIRSSRYDADDRMRYSYVEPDGETYDISDIVEAEWRGEAAPHKERSDIARDDLLHGVLSRGKDGLGVKLDRVLSKIKHEKGNGRAPVSQLSSNFVLDSTESFRSASPSDYSTADGGPSSSRAATPNANILNGRTPTPTSSAQRAASPLSRLSNYRTASPGGSSRGHSVTPSGTPQKSVRPPHDRQHSLASVISESSMYRSDSPGVTVPTRSMTQSSSEDRPRVVLPKDDFGLSHMLAIIELRAMTAKKPPLPPLDPVDELLFGREIDVNTLHPQIRDIYAGSFKELEEMDTALDNLLQHVAHVF